MDSYQAPPGLIVGVDVGGTKTAVLVVDRHCTALSQITLPTVLGDAEATLHSIVEAILQGVEQAGADIKEIAAVGVGIPGRVDASTGVVRKAVNLGWQQELPLGGRLAERLGAPCLLENDVRMAALGIHHYLGASAPPNLAYLGIGTGIAAGLILNGQLYRGAHCLAGEVGHIVIDPGGPLCACGARGCLEALAAGPAIARLGQQAASDTPGSVLHAPSQAALPHPIKAEAVFAAAREGDSAALEITRRVAGYLALALQQMIMAYDLDCIYIGGGVAQTGDALMQPLREELARLRAGSSLRTEMLSDGNVRLLPGGYNAGAWGAVALAVGSAVWIA